MLQFRERLWTLLQNIIERFERQFVGSWECWKIISQESTAKTQEVCGSRGKESSLNHQTRLCGKSSLVVCEPLRRGSEDRLEKLSFRRSRAASCRVHFRVVVNSCRVDERFRIWFSVLAVFFIDQSGKDSLYCNAKKDPLREANQHALFFALRFLLHSLSPMIPHTIEDVKQCAASQLKLEDELFEWANRPPVEVVFPFECPPSWSELNALRNSTNRLLEGCVVFLCCLLFSRTKQVLETTS
jgi:hypothetical protein